ncbi:MAG: TonB-dependent receptor [Flavobacteriaceae bacterium]|nr:TonB-dependent receptor [Flavobacteriaceae bacterium]
MKKRLFSILLATLFLQNISAQKIENTIEIDEEINLEAIEIISSPRIELPFSENSRTIQVITEEEIESSPATNISELLQQIAGVDIRRRGVSGIQADLYIRGGTFDQTLLLIDGFKVEDAQTGHHTMNMAIPIDVIKRIEIIKGAASRIYGQNAFTGAINIVTKEAVKNERSRKIGFGSFEQRDISLTLHQSYENSSFITHYSRQSSEGYRYNTDFTNNNNFIKSNFKIKALPFNMIASFNERKFGANGFYASPEAIDQYEETQASLLGVSTEIKSGSVIIKPKIYWKRNQDMYIYLRHDPSVYRNLHITNKTGIELNGSSTSKAGITGFGIDVASVSLSSNNLGNRNRTMINVFIEHQFKLLKNRLDITPGVAFNYFSDFKFNKNYKNNFFRNFLAFPGLDIGYKINDNFRIYTNIGYTYRAPTYTDLYYSSPTTVGNEKLIPEKALSEEVGIRYFKNKLNFSLVLFNRKAKDLIDYVKAIESDPWQATNIRELNTSGLEASMRIKLYGKNKKTHYINFGYSYLKDDLEPSEIQFSKYAINSLKHHITSSINLAISKNLSGSLIYKYSERTTGENYTVVDIKNTLIIKNLNFSLIINNIFDTEYYETNLVPMPGRAYLFSWGYNAKKDR